ncbi:MAG: metallopeptidase TldD-related protein [Candidatus Acidiferrales bacterium]
MQPSRPVRLLLPFLIVAIVLFVGTVGIGAAPSVATGDPVLETMQRELKRATADLAKSNPPPYFISYAVTDLDATAVIATNGSLIFANGRRLRMADVMMRVGSTALDNTHNQSRGSGIVSGALPLNNDSDAIARVLWQLTNREYDQASSAFLKVKTSTAVQSEEEDKSPDFSTETPQVHVDQALAPSSVQMKVWEDRVRALSGAFLKYPEVYSAIVSLQSSTDRTLLASSEGTALIRPGASARLVIQGETRADDGMDLMRVETFQADTVAQLPGDAELNAKVVSIATDLKALRAAPVAEPYAGPAMLSGRAAAVFFHEVLGHRLEGHRQRDEGEGQTFTKKVGQLVLPDFLSVTDDPTLKEMNGIQLAGYYDFDDEGVPAQKVNAVEAGVLKNFLMSRMPIKNFSNSNGHGRRQAGLMPTGRQGNLIVTSTKTVPDVELRAKFIDEIKRQGKPYGLYFDDIQGGFTLTGRASPQAFQVLPVMVYRVYTDGRPDELVRGVDIVGTPLLSLTKIILTGDKEHVFNGVCGAESGSVPVSAVAPAMLFSEIEVQKRRRGAERPPILPPPGFGDTPISTTSSTTAPAAPASTPSADKPAGAKP